MDKDYLAIIWDSCSELERANITFGQFLEKLGRAMATANCGETQLIKEMARNLEVALMTGSTEEIVALLNILKNQVASKIRSSR
jgi:hypothetical protein